MSLRVLGLDPGTATTGYGVIDGEGDGLRMLTYGAIITPPDMPMPERLRLIYLAATELINAQQAGAVAVEKLFFNRNVTTALSVGQARGVLLLAAANAGIAVYEYTPLEVKQALVGYGRATKPQVQQMVKMVLGLDFTPHPDDAADALAVAVCHCQSARMRALIERG